LTACRDYGTLDDVLLSAKGVVVDSFLA